MAAWQFPFFIIPKSWTDKQTEPLEHYLTEDGWDVDNTWAYESVPADYLNELDDIFPSVEPWAVDMALWKSNHHDSDIMAFFENGALSQLQMRLDLRANIESTVQDIVKFALRHQLHFLIMRDAEFCRPDVEALLAHISSSRLAKLYHGEDV